MVDIYGIGSSLTFFDSSALFFILENPIGEAVSPIDIVFFGLTLNISNINELNGLRNKSKKMSLNRDRILGLSLILIIFLAITLGMIYSSELLAVQNISLKSVYICSIFMSIASFVFSWNVMLKIQNCNGNF